MSINYNLQLETNLSPEDSMMLLETEVFQQTENGDLSGHGLIIKAQKADETSRELIKEIFGFTPKLQISFWLQPHYQDISERNKIQIKLVMKLLESTLGDAVFLFEFDKAILRRKANRLVLNQSSFKENDERLKEIKSPYTIETLPSL